MKNPGYWLRKRASRKTGYPIATIAYYGPTDKVASKVAVGIIASEHQPDPVEMQRWYSDQHDVRLDVEINSQILQFIDQHHVTRVSMLDRIIGCPHEEGVDYPEGKTCPQCPYWEDRDRWTGKKLS